MTVKLDFKGTSEAKDKSGRRLQGGVRHHPGPQHLAQIGLEGMTVGPA
jgi:hypothetical protein